MNKFAQLVYHEVLNKYNYEIQKMATFIIEEIDSIIENRQGNLEVFHLEILKGIQTTIYKDYHNVLDLDLRNSFASVMFKEETLKYYDDFIIKLSKTIAQHLGGE